MMQYKITPLVALAMPTMFLGSYLQQSSEQRQKRNDPSQRGVSLSEAIKGRGVLKKSLGPVKEEGVSEFSNEFS